MSCVSLEQKCALVDVWRIAKKRGDLIKFNDVNDETEVERDDFGSIIDKSSDYKEYYAYPINYSPSSRQIDQAGIKEDIDIMVHIPMKFFIDDNFTTGQDIDFLDQIRGDVIINEKTYKITDKSVDSQMSNVYLYVVLGLKRS